MLMLWLLPAASAVPLMIWGLSSGWAWGSQDKILSRCGRILSWCGLEFVPVRPESVRLCPGNIGHWCVAVRWRCGENRWLFRWD